MTYVIGHKNPDTDSICSAIALAYFLEITPAKQGPINPETSFVLTNFGLQEPITIYSAINHEIYLVDHAEKSQTLNDLEKGKLLGIIDHHKVGITTGEPIIYICKPLGSTASIIAELYFRNSLDYIGAKNKTMPPYIAGILLSAILSDTVIFKSPTTTEVDKSLAIKLAEIANIKDIYSYGIDMLKAKSNLTNLTPLEIFNLDYKEFILEDKKIGTTQVELIDPSIIKQKKLQIIDLMKRKLSSDNLELVLFIITDIIKEESEILAFGNTNAFEKVFNVKLSNGSVFIKDLLSRKKQVVPVLSQYYANN